MLVLTQTYSDDKVTKVGGTGKAKRIVRNRQKLEAIENKVIFKIDRADKQRNERRQKRKKYAL